MSTMFLERALLPAGWQENVRLKLSAEGEIETVETEVQADAADEVVRGVCVPGMANLHSHAFQRAMAGLTERPGATDDSFWTWREVMYGFVQRIGPNDANAIASQLYVEMLKIGYTSVAEFHYLHHGKDGVPYDDLGEMSHQIIEAARQTGLAITHLPVLYAHSGCGGTAPGEGQKRFVNNVEQFTILTSDLYTQYKDVQGVHIGMALHSLRAVSEPLLQDAVEMLNGVDTSAPIHIHIAEQPREVEECFAWSGARPVEWLLDHAEVDERWCLIHATHMSDSEIQALANSGAVAGLCPTTEANLGDGIFPAQAFLAAGGKLGIGSDSHISVDVAEELRLLEYGQRLSSNARNVLISAASENGVERSTGRNLYETALEGGAAALGRKTGKIAPGFRADLVGLDTDHPSLYGRNGDAALDSWIFANAGNPVRDVYVGGRKVVSEGVHFAENNVAGKYRAAIDRLNEV